MNKKNKRKSGIFEKIIRPINRATIGAIAGLCIVLFPVITIVVRSLENAYAEQICSNYANQLKAELDSALYTTRTLSSIAQDNIENERFDRQELESQFITVAKGRPEYNAVYAIFENGVYGDDSQYVNSNYGTETGRYAPYIVNTEGSTLALYDAYALIEGVVTEYHYTTVKDTMDQYISAPYIYEVDGASYYAISIASPIIVDGKYCGMTAVNILVDDFFERFRNCDILGNGYITLVTEKNVVAYSPKMEQIGLDIGEVYSDKMVQKINKITADSKGTSMISKSITDGSFVKSYIQPATFEGSSAVWKITVNLTMMNMNMIMYALAAFLIVFSIILIYIINKRVKKTAGEIVRPVGELVQVAAQIADGNLDVQIDYHSDDELGELAHAFRKTMKRLHSYIEDIVSNLAMVANNHLEVSANVEYRGEFIKVGDSINTIADSLSKTLWNINDSAAQVAESSDQMQKSAQSIAEGATEQSNAIFDLTKTVEKVTQAIEETDNKTHDANRVVDEISQNAKDSNEQMKRMVDAMKKIQEASQKISEIIESIESIASQTNLLSLNASIEAARAGDAGKGFAVVASEIGQLANQSEAAAQMTRELIGTSIEAVDHGTSIVTQTSASLQGVLEHINKILKVMGEISEETENQSNAMVALEESIQNIANVVDMNSATSEESAAISEELSNQSQKLKDLISEFELRERE